MSDRAWKQLERDAAALIGGKRFWSNSGESLDIESDEFIGQCKLVQRLSLAELTTLAVTAKKDGDKKQKFGIVVTKLRQGKGRKTPMLVTMTADEFRILIEALQPEPPAFEADVPLEPEETPVPVDKVEPNNGVPTHEEHVAVEQEVKHGCA